MAWARCSAPTAPTLRSKVEKGGKYTVAVDGKEYSRAGEACFDPAFSPDGSLVLVKMIENGKYHRRVVPVADFK
jgi:hypothetical protein